jgi:hypothetical protein
LDQILNSYELIKKTEKEKKKRRKKRRKGHPGNVSAQQ